MTAHPWVLVGPWYRSESVGGPPANRTTAPIFQKYGDARFMDQFNLEPQHSLRFLCEDFADRIAVDPNLVITPELRAQLDDSLKLFLHSHSRFYLVVCELHCVMPGFPSTRREQVCETGFVVRRRVPQVPKKLQVELAAQQRRQRQLKQQLLRLGTGPAAADTLLGRARRQVLGETLVNFRQQRLRNLQEQLQASVAEQQEFILANNVRAQRQGWIPTSADAAVGQWREVAAKPQVISEKIYPLYPLQGDPRDAGHSARGKSLWFGLVPTASSDMDTQGNPQFDDSDLYEIQCFVRRKKSCCEGRGRNCCRGEITWSEPTQNYRLAAYFDVDGSSHKPINIKMPDLNALKEQANLGPPGRGVNVKTIAPANSSLNFGANGMDMPSPNPDMPTRPGQQICFFAIFLFFLVALFLFRLFLPVILLLFQLWFLLKLKFCIPPSVELDVGLAADLEIHGPDIEAAIEFDAEILAEIGGGFDTEANLKIKLALDMSNTLTTAGGGEAPADYAGELYDGFATLPLNELADLYISMSRDFSEVPNPAAPQGRLPLPEDGLIYFDKVAMT